MELHYFQLFSVTVLVVIIAVFIAKERYHQLHDRIFIALQCVRIVCLFFAIKVIVEGCGGYIYLAYGTIVTPASLCLFPLALLYIRIVAKDPKWHRWYWWVFAPAAFIGVTGAVLSGLVGWDNIIGQKQGTIATFVPDPDNLVENLYRWIGVDAFNYVNMATAIAFLILCTYYLIGYNQKAKDYFANIENSGLGSIEYFFATTILLHLTMMFGYVLTLFIPQAIVNEAVIVFNLWIGLLSCMVAYFAYKIKLTEQNIEVLEANDYNDDAEDSTIGKKILIWQEREDKPYLKEGLTMIDVSKDLGVNRTSLSTYINREKGMNFNQWINTMRIEEAKRMISTSPDTKITQVASLCGFSTPQLFSRVFRQIAGMTPQGYRDSKAR